MLKYNKSCYSTGQFYPMLFPRSSSLHTFNNSSTNKNKWMDHGRQQSGITTALPASPAKVITLRLLIPNYHSVVKWTATKNDKIWTIRVQQQCNKRVTAVKGYYLFFCNRALKHLASAKLCVCFRCINAQVAKYKDRLYKNCLYRRICLSAKWLLSTLRNMLLITCFTYVSISSWFLDKN